MRERIVSLHAAAPDKPPAGMPCNGCGVCCAAEPCPAGQLLFRRRHGACPALRWSPENSCYRCGLVETPGAYLGWLPAGLAGLASRLFRRWIAAGTACDSASRVETLPKDAGMGENGESHPAPESHGQPDHR